MNKEHVTQRMDHLLDSALIMGLTWIFCPSHAGVRGNEIANRLAGSATVQGVLQMDRSYITNVILERFV
jgi:hypothetical protein